MTVSSLHSSITPVILCGGSGTRLWPLSRAICPKQLLPLVNDKSMLQNTLQRTQEVVGFHAPIIICNHEYRFVVAEQVKEMGYEKFSLFLEPEGRNTAPAITLAALHATNEQQDPVLLVMPADHVISDVAQLRNTLNAGILLAEQGFLVTFGITPDKPETGYGYIQKGLPLADSVGFHIHQFVEKPSLELAKQYITSSNYFWNSGIFLFRASSFLNAIKQFAPDILETCQKASSELVKDNDFHHLNKAFLEVRSESIDFAVMEKAKNSVVVPLDASWNDIGSWNKLWDISEKDVSGNVVQGTVFTDNVSDSYLRAEKRLLAVSGISNIAVIETHDAVLVTKKDNAESIKSLVSLLKLNQRDEAHTPNKVYRPWGFYETLNKNGLYQIKHIMVKPGAKLSLQLHEYRSEHWIVISGIALITCDDKKFSLLENQSTYIPTRAKHRIENNNPEPLHIIEVQTGTYFGEDDIVRFDDVYGRKDTVT